MAYGLMSYWVQTCEGGRDALLKADRLSPHGCPVYKTQVTIPLSDPGGILPWMGGW